MPQPKQLPTASLSLHPDAALVPEMPADQYAAFAADVKARGVLTPIELVPGTRIVIEGRTRLRAATDAGFASVPVVDADLRGDSPTVYMIRSALLRRHVTDDQRAAMGAELLDQLKKDARERQREAGKTAGRGRPKPAEPVERESAQADDTPPAKPARAPQSRDVAAKMVGSTRDRVTAAEKVKEQAPEAFARVKAGTLTLKEAKKELAPKPVKKDQEAEQTVPVAGGGLLPHEGFGAKSNSIEPLAPCPFCGSADVFVAWGIASKPGAKTPIEYVRCKGCGATGPKPGKAVPLAQVRAEWNKRAGSGDTTAAVSLSTPLADLLSVSEADKVEALKKWHPWPTVETLLELCPPAKRGMSYTSHLYAFLRALPGIGAYAPNQIGDALVNAGFVTSDGPERNPKPVVESKGKKGAKQ